MTVHVLSWMTICHARLHALKLQAHMADLVLVVCRYGLGSNSMTEGQKCASYSVLCALVHCMQLQESVA